MFEVLTLPLGPVNTNCYVVSDGESQAAVVIDPGWDAPQILAALGERQWAVQSILLTHAHFDHIGAAADLVEATGAPLAVHPQEMPLLRVGGGAALFGFHIRPCPEPRVLLQAGQEIAAGGLRFRVPFVPG